jgi:hypothetical protein
MELWPVGVAVWFANDENVYAVGQVAATEAMGIVPNWCRYSIELTKQDVEGSEVVMASVTTMLADSRCRGHYWHS